MKYIIILFLALGGIAATAEAAIPNLPENCQCGRTVRRAVCAANVPKDVLYRPKFSGCGGKAAVLLRGDFTDSFSVVVRDSQNRDRFPPAGSGYGGCSFALANSVSPPARCSAFKASSEYIAEINGKRTRVICFPETGVSSRFSDVRRITIKVRNSAASLKRYCLNKSYLPLN